MYSLLIRDEQGNMRVVHDWMRGDRPHMCDSSKCGDLARRIRSAYPNATHGLGFGFYYTGDDRKPPSDVRVNEAYEQLPDFRSFVLPDGPPDPDLPTKRTPLPQTAPHMTTQAELKAWAEEPIVDTGPLLTCSCGWSGDLDDAADYDADSRYCLDWTCPKCRRENLLALGTGKRRPINAEA